MLLDDGSLGEFAKVSKGGKCPAPQSRIMIDHHTITLPSLAAELAGLSVAHLTDLHVKKPRARFRKLVKEAAKLEADLVFLTGDYMSDPGDEPAAMAVLEAVVEQLHPRLGTFGVFGNHDSFKFRQMCQSLPVCWLDNEVACVPDQSIEIWGFETDRDTRADAVSLVRSMSTLRERRNCNGNGKEDGNQDETDRDNESAPCPLRLLLSHYPTLLPTAADLDVDIMFSGHTHGGQLRLPTRIAPYTSCDLPSKLATGVLRHRDTLAIISRGIGETFIPIRVLCAPHIPVFDLQCGSLPGEATAHIESVLHW